jgi:hypothetical protein
MTTKEPLRTFLYFFIYNRQLDNLGNALALKVRPFGSASLVRNILIEMELSVIVFNFLPPDLNTMIIMVVLWQPQTRSTRYKYHIQFNLPKLGHFIRAQTLKTSGKTNSELEVMANSSMPLMRLFNCSLLIFSSTAMIDFQKASLLR